MGGRGMTGAQWHQKAVALQKQLRSARADATRKYNRYIKAQASLRTLQQRNNPNYTAQHNQLMNVKGKAWKEYFNADMKLSAAQNAMKAHQAKRKKVKNAPKF